MFLNAKVQKDSRPIVSISERRQAARGFNMAAAWMCKTKKAGHRAVVVKQLTATVVLLLYLILLYDNMGLTRYTNRDLAE